MKKILTLLLTCIIMNSNAQNNDHIPCFKLQFSMIRENKILKLKKFKDALMKNDTVFVENEIDEMVSNLKSLKQQGKEFSFFYNFMKNDKYFDKTFESERLSAISLIEGCKKIHPYLNQKYYILNPHDLMAFYFHYLNDLLDKDDWFFRPEYNLSWGFCNSFRDYFDIDFFDSRGDYIYNEMMPIKDLYIPFKNIDERPQAPDMPFSVRIGNDNPKLVLRLQKFFNQYKQKYPKDWSNEVFQQFLSQIKTNNGVLILTYSD